MSDIMIMVSEFIIHPVTGKPQIHGIACVNGMTTGSLSWSADVEWNDSDQRINQFMLDAAIAVAEANGFTVGPRDNRVVLAGT
jgi:hypothetical protein